MHSSLQTAPSQNGPSDQVEIASISEPQRSDDELVIRARSILRWKIRYNAVYVTAENGHVTLSGHVFSDLDREAAEQTVRKMTGVVTMTNLIVTASPLLCKERRGDDAPGPQARIVVKEGRALRQKTAKNVRE